MSLSTAQIIAQLDAILAHKPDATAIAMHAPVRQDWPTALQRGTRQFELRWCGSTLALRAALSERDGQEAPQRADGAQAANGIVVLTPLETHTLPDDVSARLARGRVFAPEGWETVRELFAARHMDARLGPCPWMPQLLIDASVQGPYSPAAGGYLDLDTAWLAVNTRYLGLAVARPNGPTLLHWSQQPDCDARLAALPLPARNAVLEWLAQGAGATGRFVVGCVRTGRTSDALALGLVCDVLFATAGQGDAALAQAAVRMERYVGNEHLGLADARTWAQHAGQCILQEGVGGDLATTFHALERADALLEELRADGHAHLSAYLPRGFEQRIEQVAAALDDLMDDVSAETLSVLEHATEAVLAHHLARTRPERTDRLRMACRIARSLVAMPAATKPANAEWLQLCDAHVDHHAFVDWARFRLLGGDESHALSAAYARLRGLVAERREAIGAQFASGLARMNASAWAGSERFVPVEHILDRVVAPLAQSQPVLLLVLDGASISVFRELFANFSQRGWEEQAPASTGQPLSGIAALPTTTEASRTSLLCGRLTLGTQATEKAGFATHPQLLAASSKDMPPQLFHKGELAEDANLSSALRSAIADPKQKVVGVVYNAIDDHLSGPDQLQQRWSIEALRLLAPLLSEAKQARRMLIVTADHGHLLDDGTRAATGEEPDRWRPANRVSIAEEVLLAGGRVLNDAGQGPVVCLWSERARYRGRKNGYHGGASPQEVLVPLSVFASFGVAIDQWQPAAPSQPDWWEGPLMRGAIPPAISTTPAAAGPTKRATRRTPAVPDTQLTLPGTESTAPSSPATAAQGDWIALLLASPVYATQKQLAARVALPDAQLRALLEALAERGDTLSRTALAQRMRQPDMRMAGVLTAARRVLNVDQAAVLAVDDASATVVLNRALLQRQFQLPQAGASR